eukprot:765495_1
MACCFLNIEKKIMMVWALCFLVVSFAGQPYCKPNESCWPDAEHISTFASQFEFDEFVYQNFSSSKYIGLVNQTQNILLRQYPSWIILCKSSKDIQNIITFASTYNIQISIISTGHSYSGINTANNSIQINLSLMNNHKFNLSTQANKSTITVETGMQFEEIYYTVNKTCPHKIIIAGSEPTVGPGGCSTGGCHSPLGPLYGLGSDFITEYYMVDANSSIIHVYNSSDNAYISDLFWALKGGGD